MTALWHEDLRIDLVYNRLTDFTLDAPANAALRAAWLADAALITPHPQAHALYADKRNLVALCDEALLASWGVDAETRAILAAKIPRTELVLPHMADDLWARRKQLFFKPAAGYGSKAAYRGDKMTKRVFEEVLAGNYIAQALVPPSSRTLRVGEAPVELKLDLRNYVYAGHVQLIAARLWQGQTTNFRTPGGGFAPVLTVPGVLGGGSGMKVFGLAGWSGSGKTTLLEELIPRLTAAGLRVSLIKHAHHRFDIDHPGKDSYRLREAGCSEVLLISDQRWVLMHELRGEPEPSLDDQIARFSECDLVLVEGFKETPIPKLEVHRPSVGKPLIAGTGVETIVAVATDEAAALAGQTTLPILELNDRDAIAEFILRHMGFKHA